MTDWPVHQPLWELEGVTKRFAGVTANDRISLRIYPGEIHGLMGENGCGKSTLIKMLSGAHQPDDGRILRLGVPVRLASPIAAREAGVSTVFQEFSVVPSLTVAENVYLGRWPRKGLGIDWNAMRDGARRVLDDMAVAIDPDAIVSSLSVAEQQMVEIAKALASDATLLILDEPTTALGLSEIARLHGLLRRLKARGVAILYISHRLDEVVELVDTVTVLKEGKVAASAQESTVSIPFIVMAMVGEVGEHYPKERNATAETVLSVRNLQTANRLRGVSFDLRRGEVLASAACWAQDAPRRRAPSSDWIRILRARSSGKASPWLSLHRARPLRRVLPWFLKTASSTVCFSTLPVSRT